MTSDRPYRKALKLEQVIEELKKHSGSQFDPIVVESAIKMLEAVTNSEKAASARTETQIRVSRQFSQMVQPSG